MDQDIRWKQRFQNFEKALNHLQSSLNISEPNLTEKAGIIQFFEMTYELGWNLLKDYLEHSGFADVKSPRSAIKKGFEIGLIEDGQSWMELLLDRNLTAHTYDEEKVSEVEQLIRIKYYPIIYQLYSTFKTLSYG